MINSGCGPVRAVTLDVDDTLVNHSAAAAQALEAVGGAPDSFALWQRITDEYAAAVIAGTMPYAGMHTARTKAYFAELGEYIDDAQAEWIDTERRRELAARLRLFDDVFDCLEWLRWTGLRIGAVTNASGAHQRRKLVELGIGEYFDALVIAGEVGMKKPDPAIFEVACARLGVAPAETLHVGDKAWVDARAADEAGLHGVWLDRSSSGATAPTRVLHTLADLPELLFGEFEVEPLDVVGTPGFGVLS